MENKEKVDSPSSFTNDLFGAKDSAPVSTGIFSSIFPPPSTVLARNNSNEFLGSHPRQSAMSQTWNRGTTEDVSKNKERSPIFQERAEPCPLSSSIHYGGQEEDMYMKSSKLGSQSDFKKVGEEDDQNGNNSHIASRGNWWQGSLYY